MPDFKNVVTANLLFLLCLSAVQVEAEVTKDPEEVKRLAEFIWSGVRDGREKLTSGEYEVSGTSIDDDPIYGRLEGSVNIKSKFDYKNHLLLYERSDPVRVDKRVDLDEKGYSTHKSTKPPGGEGLGDTPSPKNSWRPGKEGGVFLRNAESSASWVFGDRGATIGGVTENASEKIKLFDIRSIGLSMWMNLHKPYPFEQRIKRWSGLKVDKIETVEKNIYIVHSVFNDVDGTIGRMWIDSSNGFTPIRSELLQGKGNQQKVAVRSDIGWEKISDAWVPIHYRIQSFEAEPRQLIYDLKFTWLSVNQKINADDFTIENMKIKAETSMFDNRLGSVINIGKIGKNHSVIPEPQPLLMDEKTETKHSSFSKRVVFVTAAFLLPFIAILFRFLRQSKNTANI